MAHLTKGFLYYVSVTGITGARTELPQDLVKALKEVRSLVKCPLAVGFGISTPEQVRWLAPYVDGVVVGSAIVSRVAEPGTTLERAARVESFVRSLHPTSELR